MTGENIYSEYVLPKISRADTQIKSLFYSLSPLYKPSFPFGQDVTVPLFTSLHSTSEGILLLLTQHGIYDADVLLRTVMEGTLKYCYLMRGTEESIQEKYSEYKVQLREIERLEDHKKADEALETLRKFSHNNLSPFESNLLSEDEYNILSSKYTRQIKNNLKKKWSYRSLLENLADLDMVYRAQLGTLYTYALTSHFCHYDWTSIVYKFETMASSDTDNGVTMDIIHALRIVSNVLSFYLFRVLEYTKRNSFHNNEISQLMKNTYELVSELDTEQNGLLEKLKEDGET